MEQDKTSQNILVDFMKILTESGMSKEHVLDQTFGLAMLLVAFTDEPVRLATPKEADIRLKAALLLRSVTQPQENR